MEKVNIEDMTALINLRENKMLFIIKDGQIFEQNLPDYGEVTVVMVGGKVNSFEIKQKRKI